jgi:FlaA1/EpsC-like NDP-sugar epimerase
MLRLCESFDVEQFVFISTDKAVTPTSVLGATKRLAEWYVRAALKPERRKIVRFGNVFGSQGSVVPLFHEQIRSGGPVQVTHPDMERYFISAPDACALVVETLLLESEASTFMLKMDPPVRIQALAEAMIQFHYSASPTDMGIDFVGIRPGEKMQESLYGPDEEPIATEHESIIGLLSTAPYSRSELDTYLDYLTSLCTANRPDVLRKLLFETELEHTKIDSQSTD